MAPLMALENEKPAYSSHQRFETVLADSSRNARLENCPDRRGFCFRNRTETYPSPSIVARARARERERERVRAEDVRSVMRAWQRRA